MFLSLKTLYRKRTVIWPFYFYTIIRTLSYLLLRIQDNGKGFNVDEKLEQSYGLKNMRERALEIGATFHIVSLPDSGTRIEVKAPLNKEDSYDD
ncbi:Sensor histidine kinase VraS [Staphylococcus aureus]|nr:Sensor histidine kinase VraS [Staphylococcus aureus]